MEKERRVSWAPIVVGAGAVGVGLYLYFRGKPVTVTPGAVVGLKVVWRNAGELPIKAEFRYDLRKNGWYEGGWMEVPTLEPGEQQEFDIQSNPIPGDWRDKSIDVRLRARAPGVTEHTVWSKDDVFHT